MNMAIRLWLYCYGYGDCYGLGMDMGMNKNTTLNMNKDKNITIHQPKACRLNQNLCTAVPNNHLNIESK